METVKLMQVLLQLPKKWQVASLVALGEIGEAEVKKKAGPPGMTAFQENLVFATEAVPDEETPRSVAERQIDQLKKSRALVEHSELEDVDVAKNVPGIIYEQTIRSPEGPHVRQMQLICKRDDIIYMLALSHLDGDLYQGARPNFRKILDSFGCA